jgi:hypothetical protein
VTRWATTAIVWIGLAFWAGLPSLQTAAGLTVAVVFGAAAWRREAPRPEPLINASEVGSEDDDAHDLGIERDGIVFL